MAAYEAQFSLNTQGPAEKLGLFVRYVRSPPVLAMSISSLVEQLGSAESAIGLYRLVESIDKIVLKRLEEEGARATATRTGLIQLKERISILLDQDFYPCKWSDHEAALLAISAAFPPLLFTLEGHGAERTDVYRKYFKGGRLQYAPAKLVFPDYDEKALK